MVDPSNITAIVVTRGDVDLAPVLEPLDCYGELIVWDNSRVRVDAGTFGRYLAAFDASHDVVYVQDDDCVIRCHDQLATAYRPGAVAANMKPERSSEYQGRALLGWGALFHRDLPWPPLDRYLKRWPLDDLFKNVACDIAFTAAVPCIHVHGGVEDLPHATVPGRTSTTAEWAGQKLEATRRARELAA